MLTKPLSAVGPDQPWKRLLAMIAFGAVGYLLLPFLLLLAVIQFGFSLWTGGGNERIGRLAAKATGLLNSILDFLLYRSHLLPFPFNPLPDDAEVNPLPDDAEVNPLPDDAEINPLPDDTEVNPLPDDAEAAGRTDDNDPAT